MSPLKIFEYIASKRPIIVADFPRIREILDEECAVFYKSENVLNLKNEIQSLLRNPKKGHKITKKAFKKVKEYTWEKRAKKILDLFKK